MMDKESKKPDSVTTSNVLHSNMRKFCETHSNGMRNVLFCVIDDLPGKAQAIQGLLDNRVEIGNAIKPYYGEHVGDILSEYIRMHIMLSIEAIKAIKSEDAEAIAEVNRKCMNNAEELALFMSKANPKWRLEEMNIMLKRFIRLSNDQIVQRVRRNYGSDVIAYEKLHNEILFISDFVSDGIALQFPRKFKTDFARKSKFVFENFF